MAETNAIIPQISFPFKIANISKLKKVWSPEVMVYGIPWKIKVGKIPFDGEQWLSIDLYCGISDKSSDWSHVAFATFKLMPISGNVGGIERYLKPYVFDCTEPGFGFPSFIKWIELINNKNNYVKDDTLTLDIKIEVAEPNIENSSKTLFKTNEKCCNEGCLAKY